MREWQGIKDSLSDIGGDHPINAVGVSFLVEGELRRRPGLTQLNANGGKAIGAFRSLVNGAWLMIAKSDGTIEGVAL